MGYLICVKCNGCYELQESESPDDFDLCQCGGNLLFLENIEDLDDLTKYCQSCGKENPYNANFCEECGHNFNSSIHTEISSQSNEKCVICPACLQSNQTNTSNCINCGKNLKETLAYYEGPQGRLEMKNIPYDLEITSSALIRYHKGRLNRKRTGKSEVYDKNKIKNIQIGKTLSQLRFHYNGKYVVINVSKENLEELENLLIEKHAKEPNEEHGKIILCPVCNHQNPTDNESCSKCGVNFKYLKSLKTASLNFSENEQNKKKIKGESPPKILKKEFKPKGSFDDFKNDVEIMKKFGDMVKKRVKDQKVSVSSKGSQDQINDRVTEQLESLKDEIENEWNELAKDLEVLSPNVITVMIIQRTEPPYNATIKLNVDNNLVNKYVDYYKAHAPNNNQYTSNSPKIAHSTHKTKKKNTKITKPKIPNNITLTFPEGKIIIPPTTSNIILKKDEAAFLALNNVSLVEPRSVRQSVGSYGGPTIRVAKGVSFRLGQSRSKSVSHEELKVIDKGSLTLTNKRLVFAGSKHTTNINLKKIVSIEAFKDGIAIQRENKQKTEHFLGTDKYNIDINTNQSIKRIPLNGSIIKTGIEALIKFNQ